MGEGCVRVCISYALHICEVITQYIHDEVCIEHFRFPLSYITRYTADLLFLMFDRSHQRSICEVQTRRKTVVQEQSDL